MDDVLAGRKLREARKALQILERAGHQAMLAGGCVRDRLLGLPPRDYDVATTAEPRVAMAVFKAQGLKTVPTGLDHGTITLVMSAGPIEVTTLRVDVATDGRHAEVAFGTSFPEDAARRDFTINAMFEDGEGTIHDYCGGRADVAARRLRFVGDATARIREDYLRILRFFRFWARLDFAPDPGALTAIAAEKDGLRKISQERVTSELLQILAAPAAPAVLAAMADSGIWRLVAPELVESGKNGPPDLAPAAPKLAPVPAEGRPLATLAVLAVGSGAPAAAGLASRLKLSRAESRRLEHAAAGFGELANFSEDRALIMEFLDAADQAGGEGSFERFFAPVWHAALMLPGVSAAPKRGAALAAAAATEAHFQAVRRQKLPVSGDDLLRERPAFTGKALGAALLALKRSFRNGDWTTRDQGISWLDINLLPPA